MVAAMVSNFLSLTTSLFTMTVYDRIIPNGAFESLIALSIGCVIALGFDFLIKGLRAKFIDVASKRADLEISRRLFDRILTLTRQNSVKKPSNGWHSWGIRNFEGILQFLYISNTIDLPFVFFFIYVFLDCRSTCVCSAGCRTPSNNRWIRRPAFSVTDYQRIS